MFVSALCLVLEPRHQKANQTLEMRARVLQRSGRRHLQTYHDHLSHIYIRHEKEEKEVKAESVL